jgi:hypothetical protein
LVNAQSKKELVAKTQQLTAEVEALKKQINDQKTQKADLNDPHKKASYALGVLVSKNLKMQGGDSLDYESLTIGIGDVFKLRLAATSTTRCRYVCAGIYATSYGS